MAAIYFAQQLGIKGIQIVAVTVCIPIIICKVNGGGGGGGDEYLFVVSGLSLTKSDVSL